MRFMLFLRVLRFPGVYSAKSIISPAGGQVQQPVLCYNILVKRLTMFPYKEAL